MRAPPTGRSRYNKRRRGTSGGYGEGNASVPAWRAPPKDPFSGVTWSRPSAMSERERDPFWNVGNRDVYAGSRVAPSLIGSMAGGEGAVEGEDEFVMPDWKDALYLQEIDLLDKAQRDADAQKLASTKTALIRLGSRSLAEKILGAGDPALAGISDDPATSFSTMAQIARQYGDLVQNINNTRNDQSLYFSSTRGNDLTRASYESQRANTEATQDVQDFLNDLQSNYLEAIREYTFQRIAAEGAARDRAIELWLLGGGRKKKKTPAPPQAGPGIQPPVPPGGPGTAWPTDPIYNPLPGGKPYPI